MRTKYLWKKFTAVLTVAALAGQLTSGPASTSRAASGQTDPALLLDRAGNISLQTGELPENWLSNAYNSDTGEVYIPDDSQGCLRAFPVKKDGTFDSPKMIPVDEPLKNLEEEFVCGEISGVTIDTVNDRIAIAVQAEDYRESGRLLLTDYEGKILDHYETGVQPEMAAFTGDGSRLITANTGKAGQDSAEDAADPAGTVTVIDIAADTEKTLGFENFDTEQLLSKGVNLRQNAGETIPAEKDLEPSSVAVKKDGSRAYLSLPSAGSVAVVDLETSKISDVEPIGCDEDIRLCEEEAKTYLLFHDDALHILDADTMKEVYRGESRGIDGGTSTTTAMLNGKMYAFSAPQSGGYTLVYDVTDPAQAEYVDRIETGQTSTCGLSYIPANHWAGKQPTLLSADTTEKAVSAYSITGRAVQEAVILYTNDVHCEISGYSKLASLREQVTEDGYRNILVDAGDAIQGDTIGALTKGSAIVDLMNQTGYEFAVPGNHEFDYTMDTFLNLAENEADYSYLSANFVDLTTDKTVFDSYQMVNVGGRNIAFVGICTPETYTKSSPAYFQNDKGEFIYSFCEGDSFYQTIQNAVDQARNDGADSVVAVGHTGIEGTTEGWKSVDIIANTNGIDVYLDAHSHETIESETYKNKDGADVLLSSTGTKFANIGELKIDPDGAVSTTLLETDAVKTDTSPEAKAAYDGVQTSIDAYNKVIDEELKTKIGTAEIELAIDDPATGIRLIRNGETNMGDFVADAYRAISDADIGLVNGGGIRAALPAGDVSKKSLMDINPWNNAMCVIEASGQQILDALEHGVKNYPEESGGFPQVSGLTFEIDPTVAESPVVTDDKGAFLSIDPSKKRRVHHVMVGNAPLDPAKTYTIAGNHYMLQEGGDGYTNFQKSTVVREDDLPVDAEMLIRYFTENLGGTITAEQYGNALGSGRIKIAENTAQPSASPAATNKPTTTSQAPASQTPTGTPAAATQAPAGTTEPRAEKITVKKAAIKSAKNLSGKKIKVKLKKISGAKGYQIKYSTSKKFAKKKTKSLTTKKTTLTIKKLKKNKTYYLKARTWKKDSTGKKVYGAYSKVKHVKIKK